MPSMRITATFIMAMMLLTIACCGRAESGSPRGEINAVLTTFYPTEYFAARISGGLVPVECPLPEGEDPASWQPSAAVLERYQRAGLVVVNGASFEEWITLASLPFSRTCDSTAGFAPEFITFESVKHRHGSEGEHSHEGIDGHTWLDPINSRMQAAAILLAMSRRWPEHEKAFRDNADPLFADLDRLDERLRAISKAGQVRIVASHPAYNYIARRYGWVLDNIDLPPEGPVDEETKGLLKSPDFVGAVLLFESEPDASVVGVVNEAGIGHAVFSPCESLDLDARGKGASFLTVMNDNIDRLTEALKGARGEIAAPQENP
jgi:zinc transport system substrate-binding protein